jgi:hypothetical protein
MISKCFEKWIKRHQEHASTNWSDYLTTGLENNNMLHTINECLDAWKQAKSFDDLLPYFHTHPDVGIGIVDQTGEFCIAHQLSFDQTTAKLYGFTTNSITEKPVEIVLHPDVFKPIMPPFEVLWNKAPPLVDIGHVTQSQTTQTTNTDPTQDSLQEQDEDTKPAAAIKKKEKGKPIRKRRISRHYKKTIDLDNNTINSMILIPAEILAIVLPLRQPFNFDELKTTLDEFDQFVMQTYTTPSEHSSIHAATGLLRTFHECAEHKTFQYNCSINQIRDDTITTKVLENTFPPFDDISSPLRSQTHQDNTPKSSKGEIRETHNRAYDHTRTPTPTNPDGVDHYENQPNYNQNTVVTQPDTDNPLTQTYTADYDDELPYPNDSTDNTEASHQQPEREYGKTQDQPTWETLVQEEMGTPQEPNLDNNAVGAAHEKHRLHHERFEIIQPTTAYGNINSPHRAADETRRTHTSDTNTIRHQTQTRNQTVQQNQTIHPVPTIHPVQNTVDQSNLTIHPVTRAIHPVPPAAKHADTTIHPVHLQTIQPVDHTGPNYNPTIHPVGTMVQNTNTTVHPVLVTDNVAQTNHPVHTNNILDPTTRSSEGDPSSRHTNGAHPMPIADHDNVNESQPTNPPIQEENPHAPRQITFRNPSLRLVAAGDNTIGHTITNTNRATSRAHTDTRQSNFSRTNTTQGPLQNQIRTHTTNQSTRSTINIRANDTAQNHEVNITQNRTRNQTATPTIAQLPPLPTTPLQPGVLSQFEQFQLFQQFLQQQQAENGTINRNIPTEPTVHNPFVQDQQQEATPNATPQTGQRNNQGHQNMQNPTVTRLMGITESLIALQMQRENRQNNPDETLTRILDSRESKRIRKFEDYAPTAQLILKRMCIVDVFDEEPQAPSPHCLEIINAGNKIQQTCYVDAILKQKKVLGRWATGHINRFIYAGPTWPSKNDPFGLTMFGIHGLNVIDAGKDNALKHAIQYGMDDKIDKADLEVLIRKETYIPQLVHDIRIVLSTFEALLSAICTPNAIIPQMMRGWVYHFDSNFEDYDTLFNERPKTFAAKLLYSIDLSSGY